MKQSTILLLTDLINSGKCDDFLQKRADGFRKSLLISENDEAREILTIIEKYFHIKKYAVSIIENYVLSQDMGEENEEIEFEYEGFYISAVVSIHCDVIKGDRIVAPDHRTTVMVLSHSIEILQDAEIFNFQVI